MFYIHVIKLVIVILALFSFVNVQAGAYIFSGEANGINIVTHPSTYTGTEDVVTIRVCIDPTSPNATDMEYSVQNNIAVFNQLTPTLDNVKLNSNNNIPNSANVLDFESIALHEIGHCLGLAHINAASESELASSLHNYTKATDGTNNSFDVNAGADGVIGSSDDVRGDDVNLVWFRKSNNDPFTIDTVVDSTTYSRDVADLPSGHLFPANADRSVSTLLGYTQTEAVMQQGSFYDEAQRTLGHDDVATLQYAKSGLNELESGGNGPFNNANDNYDLVLEYGGISTSNCDISMSMTTTSSLAFCSTSGAGLTSTHLRIATASIEFGQNYNWFFNAEVANDPVLTAIGNQSLTEGDVLVVPLSSTDADGDNIVYSSSGLPSFASLVDNGDGTADLTLSPALGDAVATSMTITVTDDSASALTDDETFNITVAVLEIAPVLNAIGNQSLTEGDVLVIPLLASDANGDNVAYSSSGLPSFASLVDNGDGTADLTLSPTFGDAVATSMTITVTDDSASTLTDDETFNITVAVLEVAPVLNAVGNQTLAEGDVLIIPLSTSDVNNDLISYSSSGLPSFASLVDNGNGTAVLTLSPNFNDVTSTSMTITVTDNSILALIDDETFDITVTNVEVAPVLNVIGNQMVGIDNVLVVPLSATDGDGDNITYSSSGLPSFASLIDNGDGTADLTLSPTLGDAVLTSMTITVTDDSASVLTDDETFDVVVFIGVPLPMWTVFSMVVGIMVVFVARERIVKK